MRKTQRINNLFIILMLVLTALGNTSLDARASISSAELKANPSLQRLAAGQQVTVIVQKTGKGVSPEETVRRLGGEVTRDLHIINAFAARMTVNAALQLARDPGVRWVSLDAPVKQSDTDAVFTTWATTATNLVPNTFTNSAAMIDSSAGPNGTYGSGRTVMGSFGGFVGEVTPDNVITKVEVVLKAYVPSGLTGDLQLTIYVGGVPGQTMTFGSGLFDGVVSAENANLVDIDVTSTRSAWQWSDFDSGIELLIDQSGITSQADLIYYDAIGLLVTSQPGMATPVDSGGDTSAVTSVGATSQSNFYNQVIRASDLWDTSAKIQGKGVTVAVVDSGVYKTKDINKRLRASVNFNSNFHNAADRFGHGTFVAGIIAGNGSQSGKKYMGVAPRADLLNLRVSDDQGMATEADVISALQWVNDHRSRYNIRVVNLSLNTAVAQPYLTSPLDAACEILWFNGIVVVVAAGNNGDNNIYPPANDPFVITVGATNDNATLSTGDDTVASFSAYGSTENGFAKPDLVAPGKNIIGLLPNNDQLGLGKAHPASRVDKTYFRMSGTSVSTPIVSGAVALLLQDEPNLTPDQVKFRLMATANKNWPGYDPAKAGAGYLDINAAVHGTTTQSANTGLNASDLLTTGTDPVNSSVSWNSVSWNSVSWNSVSWNSVSWNSVSWNSVSWNSDYWGQ